MNQWGWCRWWMRCRVGISWTRRPGQAAHARRGVSAAARHLVQSLVSVTRGSAVVCVRASVLSCVRVCHGVPLPGPRWGLRPCKVNKPPEFAAGFASSAGFDGSLLGSRVRRLSGSRSGNYCLNNTKPTWKSFSNSKMFVLTNSIWKQLTLYHKLFLFSSHCLQTPTWFTFA